MFGLEKKEKSLFQFDLEKELKTDAKKKDLLLKEIEETINSIKNLIRQGASSSDFENYGTLLHGYTALQKVIKKVSTSK
ncbi:MAG: needle chaperone SctE [Chlamydiae bacterium]|nr:needle chaperone SctE [Chlamydiota bacterium]